MCTQWNLLKNKTRIFSECLMRNLERLLIGFKLFLSKNPLCLNLYYWRLNGCFFFTDNLTGYSRTGYRMRKFWSTCVTIKYQAVLDVWKMFFRYLKNVDIQGVFWAFNKSPKLNKYKKMLRRLKEAWDDLAYRHLDVFWKSYGIASPCAILYLWLTVGYRKITLRRRRLY